MTTRFDAWLTREPELRVVPEEPESDCDCHGLAIEVAGEDVWVCVFCGSEVEVVSVVTRTNRGSNRTTYFVAWDDMVSARWTADRSQARRLTEALALAVQREMIKFDWHNSYGVEVYC